jgi:hypothetical protein
MKYFKLNQTVYHPVYGKGEVTNTNFENEIYPIIVKFMSFTVSFTEDGRQFEGHPISLSQNPIPEIVNKPVEEYVRFTFEDRELLRGQWVRRKISKEEFMIIYLGQLKVGVDGNYYTYQELFGDFEFIDGKPCGKL